MRGLFVLILPLLIVGCSSNRVSSSIHPGSATSSATSELVIDRVSPVVQSLLHSTLHETHTTIIATHQTVAARPAQYKQRAVTGTLKAPWEGMRKLERHGLLTAELAEVRPLNLPALLDRLEAGMDRFSAPVTPLPIPAGSDRRGTIAFILEVLHQAALHRERALADLSDQERAFLFEHGRALAESYTPQISVLSDVTVSQILSNTRFAKLLEERVKYEHLLAAGQVLALLTNTRWLDKLAAVLPDTVSPAQVPPGITGEVRLIQNTPEGVIVVGGPGPNTYELEGPVALILDLGGDDWYRGVVGASHDAHYGNALVIDLAGNDRYTGAPLGLATGRLGIGLLFDRSGDDRYELSPGSGGAGFGGLGILVDVQGNDQYLGNRLTQGAAIGGLGLLIDTAGNDHHHSHGFSLGFGGPLGLGAIIDTEGDDQYQCGDAIPSAYNAHEAPTVKAGDPGFQYDCFGLGTGAGARVLTKQPEWQAQSLAGGIGLLVDLKGHDRYQSANFSQGMGYFFGAGLLLDLDGTDEYQAARYGHGASAHYGVALFIDHHGNDRYGSTGPYYNAGVAWDHGVSLTIDAGTGHDNYTFDRTTGLGKADHTGWAVFVDEGGNDHYIIQSGYGEVSERSLAGFIDLAGDDQYTVLSPSANIHPSNSMSTSHAQGSLSRDR
ncbi:MAG: hypothetical protein JSS38_15315 [Nitrospira sp.]|nr:hypothetical protein [Nitrospira sp.]